MIDLAIENNDLYLDDAGDLATVDDTDAIDQGVLIGFRTIQGEYYLDTNIGLPWFTVLFEKGTKPETVEAYVKRSILSAPGVKSLDSLEIDIDAATRALTATAEAFTEDGTSTDFNLESP